MKKVELLAPAGSMESLYAAVQAGADAVYLGGSKFSARAYASNFDDENMKKAVEYCHVYGVKVYITLNTLLKEKEIEEALQYAKFLYKIGVDGLIIQDTGLVYLLREQVPELELHASTQMTVHNIEGAKLLKELGFKRIVLSRELSLEEIKNISNELGVETEIFVHGALCICYSGQCLMSSIIGGRSGNRGRCAQPCRLPYTLLNKTCGIEKKGYLLSPKDISTLENIEDIILSRASSLKIEGRMKRPEYVAGVVEIYRKAIDSLEEKIEDNKFEHKKESKKLLQLFNREGFSKAYLYGNVGKDMMAYSFPKNTGLFLGKVNKDLTITLEEEINLKDGVRNKEKGFTVSKIIKNNKEVENGFKGDRVKLYPVNYSFGDELFKTSDISLLKEYEKYYMNPYNKKVNLNIEINFKVDSPITISTNINGKDILVEGDIVQKAIKRPLEKSKIEENLNKTGDTPFKFESIIFRKYEEGFLPVSSINDIRRRLLLMVEEEVLSKWNREVKTVLKEEKVEKYNKIKGNIPECLVYITTKEQLKAACDCGIVNICFNPFMRKNQVSIEELKDKNLNIYLKIPNIIKQEFKTIKKFIENNAKYISGIVTANLGIINEFKEQVTIIGDYKLNMFNSYSINFYEDILSGNCLSVELNKKEIENVLKNNKNNIQNLVYGKIEVMVSEYCPIGSNFGGKCKDKECNGYCKGKDFQLIDRMDERFSVLTDNFCRSYVYNSVPLNLIPNINELENMGISSFRLDFIDENYDNTLDILRAFTKKSFTKDFNNFTRGHYKRGVE
ncbi:DUF3656 domain-containing U32 family peptidase [Clostridium lundense]|uniref:DUF3656 domain-containing U32 family peptidase n=1 Tax=Clostridium lundense TaxID=319475 RepID=UPI0004812404|nr:U32 family peptidase [Clostridium lundense]